MSQPRDDRQDDLFRPHQPSSSAGAAGGGDRLGLSGGTLQLGVSGGTLLFVKYISDRYAGVPLSCRDSCRTSSSCSGSALCRNFFGNIRNNIRNFKMRAVDEPRRSTASAAGRLQMKK